MKRCFAMALAVMLMMTMTALAAGSELTLREGRYIVGEDIDAGSYILTCTGTTGDQMGTAYGALGNAMDALGGSGYGNLFNAFGGLMAEELTMTVAILGSYGDVVASRELKTGERVKLTLKKGTALKIADGSCILARDK